MRHGHVSNGDARGGDRATDNTVNYEFSAVYCGCPRWFSKRYPRNVGGRPGCSESYIYRAGCRTRCRFRCVESPAKLSTNLEFPRSGGNGRTSDISACGCRGRLRGGRIIVFLFKSCRYISNRIFYRHISRAIIAIYTGSVSNRADINQVRICRAPYGGKWGSAGNIKLILCYSIRAFSSRIVISKRARSIVPQTA